MGVEGDVLYNVGGGGNKVEIQTFVWYQITFFFLDQLKTNKKFKFKFKSGQKFLLILPIKKKVLS